MSTSLSSEKTPLSNLRETKTFEKFGATYILYVDTETRKEWIPVHKLPDGTRIDTTTTDWVKNLPKGVRPIQDWIETDKFISSSYVVQAMYKDAELCVQAKPILMYSTPDGPILGVTLEEGQDFVLLQDPCIVQFEDLKGTIKLLPIFNVARTLRLMKSAIRAIQPPAEPIVAIYPGYVIQSKMWKYALKAKVAVVQSEPTAEVADPVTA